jgi:hypothetical protein
LTFDGYVPAVTGSPLPTYVEYNSTINPSIDLFFQTVAFRYGHSAVPNFILQVEEDGSASPQGHIAVRDSLFNIKFTRQYGIEPILRGLAVQPENVIDALVTQEIRQPLHNLRFDVPAFNVQRGRDMGIPSYNEARIYFGLSAANSMADITTDLDTQLILEEVYLGNVTNVDAYVGGLAEPHLPGARVGALFAASIKDQFLRLRDGDRFYYRSATSFYEPDDMDEVDAMTWDQLVTLNTKILKFPSSPFLVVSEPRSAFRNVTMDCTSTTNTTTNATSNVVTIAPGFAANWTATGDTITFDFNLGYDVGWFGLGLGLKMKNIDIMVVTVNGDSVTAEDYWSDEQVAVKDTSLGSKNDIMNVQDLGSIRGYKKVVRFSRYIAASDSKDVAIRDGFNDVVYAYSTSSSVVGYHGPSSRGSLQINFLSVSAGGSLPVIIGSGISSGWTTPVKVLHGVVMLVSFGVLIPVAIYITRYYHGVRVSLSLY